MNGREGYPGESGDPGDLILPPGTRGRKGLLGDEGYPGSQGLDVIYYSSFYI